MSLILKAIFLLISSANSAVVVEKELKFEASGDYELRGKRN